MDGWRWTLVVPLSLKNAPGACRRSVWTVVDVCLINDFTAQYNSIFTILRLRKLAGILISIERSEELPAGASPETTDA